MQCSSTDFDWNADSIARLKSLWAEGHPTAEIGRRMGVSKNAVIGKSHRLNLPARPSPIRGGGGGDTLPRRPRCPTLPELQNPQASGGISVSAAAVPTEVSPARRAAVKLVPISREMMPASQALRGTRPCCWPIGEPGTRSFRFCDAPNEAGKPYCPDHCAIAYQRKEPRQKAA